MISSEYKNLIPLKSIKAKVKYTWSIIKHKGKKVWEPQKCKAFKYVVQDENSEQQIKNNLKTKRLKFDRAIENRTKFNRAQKTEQMSARIALPADLVPVLWRYRDVGQWQCHYRGHTSDQNHRHRTCKLPFLPCMTSETGPDWKEKNLGNCSYSKDIRTTWNKLLWTEESLLKRVQNRLHDC